MIITSLIKIKNMIIDRKFLVIVILFTFIMFMGDSPISDGKTNNTLIYMLLHYTKEELAGMGEELSSINIILRMREFKWLTILFPVFVTYCGSFDYYNCMITNYKRCGQIRTTRKKYIITNFVAPIMNAGITLTVSFIAFSLLVFALFPDISMCEGITYKVSFFSKFFGISGVEKLRNYLFMYFNLLLISFLYMSVVVIFLEMLKDIFFAVSIPMVISYTGYMILNYHLAKLFENYGFDYSMSKLKYEIINPIIMINADYQFENIFGKSYLLFAGILIVFNVVLNLILIRWINRRMRFQEM